MPKPRQSSRGKGSGRSTKKPKAKPKAKPSAQPETGSRATARDIGEALGVSVAMVGKLRDRGMPCVKEGRRYFYDLDACKAWHAANTLNSGNGGKREGAGRKRTRWVETAKKAGGPPSPQPSPSGGEGAEPQRPKQQGDEPRTSKAAVSAAVASVGSDLEVEDLHELTGAELQQKKLIEEVLLLRIKRSQEEAKLVDVDEMRKSLSRATAALSRSLGQVGKSIAGRVIDTVGAEPGHTETVRQIIDEQIDEALGELAGLMGTQDGGGHAG